MTATQLTLDDCEPDWTHPHGDQPGEHAPTPFDCRQHEMRDLHNQGAGPAALWTAHTIDPGRYL